MVKYCSLAPKEGKNGPREGPDSEWNRVRMVTRPLELRTDSSETHPMLAKIGDANIIYLPTPKTKGQLHSLLNHMGYYRNFVRRYAVNIAPLKEWLMKMVWFYCIDPNQANIFLGLKYSGLNLVLGEDAEEAQVIEIGVIGMPKSQEVWRLAVGMVTSPKNIKLPLKGAGRLPNGKFQFKFTLSIDACRHYKKG